MACDTIVDGGGQGVISVTANVAPATMHTMCMLALDGDAQGARDVDATLRALHEGLFVESNPIPVKWALAQMGLIGAGIRLPMTPLSARFHDTVRHAMDEACVSVATA
jgi:4-hydroxy-tetrahydrodipicolinate synthase